MRCHSTKYKQKEAYSEELAQIFTMITFTEPHQAYGNIGEADWGSPGPGIGGNLAGRARQSPRSCPRSTRHYLDWPDFYYF